MSSTTLPPGQTERADFPRFGLLAFANRFPQAPDCTSVMIGGDVHQPITLEQVCDSAARCEQVSDFHCVTTWSHRGLHWSGIRFADFHANVVIPQAQPHAGVQCVVMRGQDGYRSIMPLSDLLASDVLLADRLNGEPLSVAHGAPLRLVAPAHYGYKSVKHIHSLEFLVDSRSFRPSGLRCIAHPRARVAQEERGIGIPGWALRRVYRPLIGHVAGRFATAMANYLDDTKKP